MNKNACMLWKHAFENRKGDKIQNPETQRMIRIHTKSFDKIIKSCKDNGIIINYDDNDNTINKQNMYQCKNEYSYNDNEIIDMLKKSIKQYYINGARSSSKLEILHSFINCVINHKIKELDPTIHEYISIYSYPIKELKVHGIIYDKNVDITVKYKSRIIGIVSVKFIMSNYSQNNINYIESMLGECINLKAKNNKRVFWHPIFIFNTIPYYDKNNNIKKNEKMKLNKYNNLLQYMINHSNDFTLLPDFVSITIINNNRDLINPNILNESLDTYIDKLIDNDKVFVDIDKTFDFIINLENFCHKIIEKIKTNNSLSYSLESSISSN